VKKVPQWRFKWNRELEEAWAKLMLVEDGELQRKRAKANLRKVFAKKTDGGDGKPARDLDKEVENEYNKGLRAVYKEWAEVWPQGWLDWTKLRDAYNRLAKAKAKEDQKVLGPPAPPVEDCGTCKFCVDKPSRGGANTLRRACVLKQGAEGPPGGQPHL
jgi:hypothetical protein